MTRHLPWKESDITKTHATQATIKRTPYQTPMARSMLRDLGTAARAGKLTSHEAGFVASLERQAALGRWHPSPRQVAAILRLHQSTRGGVS